MLTWKIFVIIMFVISLALINVNSSDNRYPVTLRSSRGRPPIPLRRSSDNVNPLGGPSSSRLIGPRPSLTNVDNTNMSEIILYDPSQKQDFPLRFNNYNPLRDMRFGNICYRQIRVFCDTQPDNSQSYNCIQNAILFYKSNLQFKKADNAYEDISNEVLHFFATFPINTGNFPLPYPFCQEKANEYIQGLPEYKIIVDFPNVLWNEIRKHAKWCLGVLKDYKAYVPSKEINPDEKERVLNKARYDIAMYALNEKTILGMQPAVTNYQLHYLHTIANAVTSSSEIHNPYTYCLNLQKELDNNPFQTD